MHLPEELQEAIALEAEKFKLKEIQAAREQLTKRYRNTEKKASPAIANERERCAYLVARMPATYAVIRGVLNELIGRMGDEELCSLLDLGAGPGTVMWAAGSLLPSITRYCLVEQDAESMKLGKRLAGVSKISALSEAEWRLQKMESLHEISKHDIVILSYSIGELPSSDVGPLIEKCWALTNRYLIVIEPGTRKGFEVIRGVRGRLVESGAHLVAPCPHAAECPMSEDDWCHFFRRIERSSLHRQTKKGTLGYEDEKYSYLIAAKEPCIYPQARVLRHPQKRSGHVGLELCTREGLKSQIVSKRTPEEYKSARKLEWGSVID